MLTGERPFVDSSCRGSSLLTRLAPGLATAIESHAFEETRPTARLVAFAMPLAKAGCQLSGVEAS